MLLTPSLTVLVEGKNQLRYTADPIGCIAQPGVQVTLHIAVRTDLLGKRRIRAKRLPTSRPCN